MGFLAAGKPARSSLLSNSPSVRRHHCRAEFYTSISYEQYQTAPEGGRTYTRHVIPKIYYNTIEKSVSQSIFPARDGAGTYRDGSRIVYPLFQSFLCEASGGFLSPVWSYRWWREHNHGPAHISGSVAGKAHWEGEYNGLDKVDKHSADDHDWFDRPFAAGRYTVSFPSGYYGHVAGHSAGFLDGGSP